MKNQTPLYIIWDTQKNIGISILDEQHRGIVATINSLYYFIQHGHGLEALQPTLQILEQYIGFHLKTEEMFLNEGLYPDITENLIMQKQILNSLRRVSNEAKLNKDPDLLLQFIKNWWIDHIRKEHKEYSQYLC